MKESKFTNYDELPLFLNAKLVAQTLGIGLASAYELMHDEGFPSMRVGSRFVVPKDIQRRRTFSPRPNGSAPRNSRN